jgi:hypothetical protein
MSAANILSNPILAAPAITAAYSGSGGPAPAPILATSVEIFNVALIPSSAFTPTPFTPTISGSYIFEYTTIVGTGVISAPAGSYYGFTVTDTAPGANDYGAFRRGDSIIAAAAPETQIAFTMTSTHDLVAGTAYPINTINNGNVSQAGIGMGALLEVTGPL